MSRKVTFFIITMVLGLVALPVITQAQVQNLIKNHSFEEDELVLDDGDWSTWTTWNPAGGAGSTVEIVGTESIDGSRSLRVDARGTADWHFIVIHGELPMDTGEDYTASIWAKAEEARTFAMKFKAQDNSADGTVTQYDLTTEWAEYTFTAPAPAASVKWEIFTYDNGIPMWLDYAHVYKGPYVPGLEPSGLGIPVQAADPSPAGDAADVVRDLVLEWTPGTYAVSHDVYLGTVWEDVNAASIANPLDVLVSQGLTDNSLDAGRLEFDQTYYWRVDEVNGAPDNTVFKGEVWSFTTEPVSYPIAAVTATASSSQDAQMVPGKTVDGSGLSALDQHGVTATDMWLSGPGDPDPSIQYEFDQAYKLHEVWVWNSNQLIESFLGFGAKDVTIETSVDGDAWTTLEGVPQFAQGTSTTDYAHNTVVDFAGAVAKHVRLTINSGWGAMPQYGLSEVRFFYIPVQARQPVPGDGSMVDDAAPTLKWRAGREADAHEVYLGVDAQDLPLLTTTAEPQAPASELNYATTYYWSITEVNENEDPAAYASDVWRFATPAYGVVDDFDQYDNDCHRIFFAWTDGLGHNGGTEIDNCDVAPSNGNGGGSIVGNAQAPFAETTIVNAGSDQSMPFGYDNAFGPSEATLAIDGQDWTAHGIETLGLAFRGVAGNSGQFYVKINNTKIAYDQDPADIARSVWQAWNIDLTGVAGLGNVTTFTIGVEGNGAAGMLYIDDIRLYPLPGTLVTPAEPGSTNLVALYAFDGNANDSSGNGYNGVESGMPTYAPGVKGQALSLDGFASYVAVDSVGISGADPRTIAGWAKASAHQLSDWTNVFGFTGPSANGEHFDIEIVGGSGTTTSGFFGLHRHGWEVDITANDEEWHHLAATFDGATVSWYGDGQILGSAAAGNVNTPGPVHMGRRQDNDNYFEGLIDDVRIYDVALSPEEILWLAGRTSPIHRPL